MGKNNNKGLRRNKGKWILKNVYSKKYRLLYIEKLKSKIRSENLVNQLKKIIN